MIGGYDAIIPHGLSAEAAQDLVRSYFEESWPESIIEELRDDEEMERVMKKTGFGSPEHKAEVSAGKESEGAEKTKEEK